MIPILDDPSSLNHHDLLSFADCCKPLGANDVERSRELFFNNVFTSRFGMGFRGCLVKIDSEEQLRVLQGPWISTPRGPLASPFSGYVLESKWNLSKRVIEVMNQGVAMEVSPQPVGLTRAKVSPF